MIYKHRTTIYLITRALLEDARPIHTGIACRTDHSTGSAGSTVFENFEINTFTAAIYLTSRTSLKDARPSHTGITCLADFSAGPAVIGVITGVTHSPLHFA